ncbi:helix-turn-helix transcriptional regulator [Brevibacillus parabrevis]|jgi:Predicted transcriptional regulators|uniref:helix-turn-helix domain-containing protein n=1 Tax=Brevibacillus parabrevis TaxID=54914 RepID=UPI002490130A|nr:helix-turn-helix transcriptional regulator [Brevibacillus parabrevis]
MVHVNVRRIRKAKGVTKTHMANMLGISLQGYSHIEQGNVRLDVERLRIIAAILSVEVAIFFDDELTKSVVEKLMQAKPA